MKADPRDLLRTDDPEPFGEVDLTPYIDATRTAVFTMTMDCQMPAETIELLFGCDQESHIGRGTD